MEAGIFNVPWDDSSSEGEGDREEREERERGRENARPDSPSRKGITTATTVEFCKITAGVFMKL